MQKIKEIVGNNKIAFLALGAFGLGASLFYGYYSLNKELEHNMYDIELIQRKFNDISSKNKQFYSDLMKSKIDEEKLKSTVFVQLEDNLLTLATVKEIFKYCVSIGIQTILNVRAQYSEKRRSNIDNIQLYVLDYLVQLDTLELVKKAVLNHVLAALNISEKQFQASIENLKVKKQIDRDYYDDLMYDTQTRATVSAETQAKITETLLEEIFDFELKHIIVEEPKLEQFYGMLGQKTYLNLVNNRVRDMIQINYGIDNFDLMFAIKQFDKSILIIQYLKQKQNMFTEIIEIRQNQLKQEKLIPIGVQQQQSQQQQKK